MRFLLVLLVLLAGCGSSTRIGIISSPGTASIGGTVSLVHVTVMSDANGTSVTVTAVTLVSAGVPLNAAFCGDHSGDFPLQSNVTATFTPGATCSTLVSVRTA